MATIAPAWLPWWLFALLAAALGLATVVLYHRDRSTVGARVGLVLTALRLVVVLGTLFVLLDLSSVETSAERVRGELLVVVDTSRSMALPTTWDDTGSTPPTRATASREALEADALARLRERFVVTLLGLDREAWPVDSLSTLHAEGEGTDLAGPLVAAVARRPREALAGILLLSDGCHHGSEAPAEAARTIGAMSVPIHTVAVGPPDRPLDLGVQSIDGGGEVLLGDEILLEVALSSSRLGARRVPISVEDVEAGETRTFEVDLPEVDGISRWPLALEARHPGPRRLVVRVPEIDGERRVENNRSEVRVSVRGEPLRVLLIDGGPRWEYRYLRTAWERDEQVELTTALASPAPDRRLPNAIARGAEALLEPDLVVLGDVEPGLFSTEELAALRRRVLEAGGALVLIAGPRAMPYAWRDTPLADLLPVELLSPPPPRDLGARLAIGGPALELRPGGELAAPFRLTAGRERNLELWSLLPAPLWFQPVADTRPGCDELVAIRAASRATDASAADGDSGTTPVFVSAERGAGRILYCGIDATWRWRYRFGDLLHRRFWGRVARWSVAERWSESDGVARIRAQVRGADPRLVVDAVLSLDDAAEAPPTEPDLVEALVRRTDVTTTTDDPEPRRVRLERVPGPGARYRGELDAALALGAADIAERSAEVSVTLSLPDVPGYAEREGRARTVVSVPVPHVDEHLDLARDDATLEALSRESGGARIPLTDLAARVDTLPTRDRVVETESRWRVVDHGWTIGVVWIGLLTLEWTLRKRRSLV